MNTTLESESEESGYGDTYGDTMQASSFDTHLDEYSFVVESEKTCTPLSYIESDDESTASFISGEFPPVDPENLIERSTQTPGHVRTQTLELKYYCRTSMTQTENFHSAVGMQTSTLSLHSVGAQTKRSSNSRVNLLRGILSEVKDIKRQHGLSDSRNETMSIASDVTISREMLESLYHDVASLRATGSKANAMVQTVFDQSTQTSSRLFPEGDSQMQVQQGRTNDITEEFHLLKRENQSNIQNTLPDFNHQIPTHSQVNTFPARFDSSYLPAQTVPAPFVNSHAYTAQDLSATFPPGTHAVMNGGRRLVTQEDLNNISERLGRLNNYQIPYRQGPVLPAYQPQVVTPPSQHQVMMPHFHPTAAQHRPVREFTRSFDDIDVLTNDAHRKRRRRSYQEGWSQDVVMDRYHLDDALLEAGRVARHLKRMSAKMKRNLKEELNRSKY